MRFSHVRVDQVNFNKNQLQESFTELHRMIRNVEGQKSDPFF